MCNTENLFVSPREFYIKYLKIINRLNDIIRQAWFYRRRGIQYSKQINL